MPLDHLTPSNAERYVSSPFSKRRVNPVTGKVEEHNGVDLIGQRVGAPVRAFADGEVITSKFDPTAGNMVRLDHGQGVHTRYLHLNSLSVVAGQRVKKGDIIGTYGSTGQSTGPHLHFEVRRGGMPGVAEDPLPYLKGQPLHGPMLTVNGKPTMVPVKVANGRTWIQLQGENGPVWVQVASFAFALNANLTWNQATLTADMKL